MLDRNLLKGKTSSVRERCENDFSRKWTTCSWIIQTFGQESRKTIRRYSGPPQKIAWFKKLSLQTVPSTYKRDVLIPMYKRHFSSVAFTVQGQSLFVINSYLSMIKSNTREATRAILYANSQAKANRALRRHSIQPSSTSSRLPNASSNDQLAVGPASSVFATPSSTSGRASQTWFEILHQHRFIWPIK